MPLHAILEASGYAVGYQVYRRLKRIHGDFLSPTHRFQLVIAAILGALIGSKIPGLLDSLLTESAHRAWFSSKTVVGGLLGGLVAVESLKAFYGIRRATGDLWTQPVLIGMILGRLGCFLAGPADGTWGKETASFVGIDTGSGVALHPAPLYEILFLSGCAIIAYSLASCRPHWNRFRLFLLAYLLFRLSIDLLKSDPVILWGLTSIQWTCVIGILGLVVQFRRLSDWHMSNPEKA